MKIVKNNKLKVTLIAAFSMVFVCFSLISICSLYSTSLIDESVQGFTLGFYQNDYLARTSGFLHRGGSEPREVAASLKNAFQAFDGFLTVAPVKTASGVKKTNELKAAMENIRRSPSAQNIAAFDKLASDFRNLILQYDVKGTQSSVDRAYHQSAAIIIAIFVAFMAGSLLFYCVLRKEFFAVTNRIKRNIRAVAKGDLRGQSHGSEQDINGIHAELDGMRHALIHIASAIKEASLHMGHIAGDVAQGNQNLSARTEEQASALQQTAASMEQIKITVAHNSDNAREGNILAAKANEVALSGAEVMTSVIDSMQKIERSAKQIAEINSVINGIASQTNILALNAAVEAARAGAQGRGFAVVASEVRNLARRSAEAANEIGSLIQGAVVNVSEGTVQVSQAGKAMEEIVTAIGQVSGIMKEITEASEEQSTGIHQVATALNEMDTATQQNAVLVEASSSVTDEMHVQAKKLANVVDVFIFDAASAAPEENDSAILPS